MALIEDFSGNKPYMLLKGKYSLDEERVDLQSMKNEYDLEPVLLDIQQVEEIDVGVEDSKQAHVRTGSSPHVGTGAFARLGFLREPSCPSWLKICAGCPILARNLRKGGIPRNPGSLGFRSGILCPSWLKVFAAITAITLTTACRIDMHVQPRQNPLSRSDFFSDQRSARPLVEGTVARGQSHEDTYFYTGKIGANPGDVMPFPVTKEVLERGQERFNIFCAPCHSRLETATASCPRADSPASHPPITSSGCGRRLWDTSMTSSPKVSGSCPTTPRRFRHGIAGTLWPTFAPCS